MSVSEMNGSEGAGTEFPFFVWQHNLGISLVPDLCYNGSQMKQEASSHNEAEPLCLYKELRWGGSAGQTCGRRIMFHSCTSLSLFV